MAKSPASRDWFVCPVCGEEVAAGALACPGCGADDRTGWSTEAEYDGVDLPEPEGDAVPEDLKDPAAENAGAGVPAWIVVAAVLLLAFFVLLALAGAI
jgi:hypothetical protein